MAELWDNINFRTIHRALKKIGFTRKKRPMDIKKEMKFKEIIATKDPKSLVFLDESIIQKTMLMDIARKL
ncbi:MAG: hypothetical protein U0X86_000410 [Wolbachia endosymbiont of Xenopsylla cheopis]